MAADLRELGVRSGQHLLVHCSLHSIGPLNGGPLAVLNALREVMGRATIVVPTYTPRNSMSSASFRAATRGLNHDRLDRYVADMPGFDPMKTPSEDMGALAEYIRTMPEAVRTGHPQTSFAALGDQAAECTLDHALDGRFGESSPLGWLHRHDAAALLLGVQYDAFSAFHLAEYRLSCVPPRRAYHCYVMEGGRRRAYELWDVDLDDSDFVALGRRMDSAPFVREGRVGDAKCRLVPIRQAVEFAENDREFQDRRMVAATGPAASPGRRNVPSMAPRSGSAVPDRYFFLSYARLPPVPPVRGADLTDPPDEWVRAFFHDLSVAVSRRAASGSVPRPGFLGTEDASGRHWRSGLAENLGAAEVFVPLLSPDYYRRSWPRREWASFTQRLKEARVPEPQRRITPVLWVPLQAGVRTPEFMAALSLAGDASLEPYGQNGLCALLRQPGYRGFYEQVVAELATRIVAIAEKAPLGPQRIRIHDTPAVLRQGAGGKEFTVLLAGRPGSQAVAAPPAEYACLTAERMGYAVRIAEFSLSADEPGANPGVLLVDRGAVGRETPAGDLDAAIARLPSWVLPVVVEDWAAGRPADVSLFSLEKSHEAYKRRPETVRHGLQGVGSLQEFVALMPFLVAQAEREYLRHGPIQRSASRLPSRPGLASSGGSAGLPVKENPHD
ncbi:MAG TPA: TIR-like protein FxsC [Trebonia sp.]|nr:TIR-like protein FxsC [Trebonia sp.]